MKYLPVFFLGILILVRCNTMIEDSKTINNESSLLHQKEKLDNKVVPEKLLTLDSSPNGVAKEDSVSENLFGKFFCDRAEFYIIKNPQNRVYSKGVKSITLYYLDGALRQTKYSLKDDIVKTLLHELGSFKIIGLDPRNREIISARQIIIQSEKGATMNNNLDNYEIKWTTSNKEIKYRVNRESRDKFIYIEKAKDYEREFKMIEKHCSIIISDNAGKMKAFLRRIKWLKNFGSPTHKNQEFLILVSIHLVEFLEKRK